MRMFKVTGLRSPANLGSETQRELQKYLFY